MGLSLIATVAPQNLVSLETAGHRLARMGCRTNHDHRATIRLVKYRAIVSGAPVLHLVLVEVNFHRISSILTGNSVDRRSIQLVVGLSHNSRATIFWLRLPN